MLLPAVRPLTSIVTHKDGDKEPGAGFYDMAKTLGYDVRKPYVFWASQVQDVFKLHGRPSGAPPPVIVPDPACERSMIALSPRGWLVHQATM